MAVGARPDPAQEPEHSSSTHGTPSKQFSPQRPHESRTQTWWIFEILALLFSFGSFCALFIVLIVYNDRPLDDWHPGITLNAIVAISSTISQSALIPLLASCISQLKWIYYHGESGRRLLDFQLFDSASRGPSGALNLLLRGKAFPLATIGAFVMATALAFGTFVQQSVVYPTRNITSGLAEIPRTDYWDGIFDTSFKLAAYDALLGFNLSKTASAISPTCTTGNCAFQDYSSLGICSQCVDVSSLLTTALPNFELAYGGDLGCASYPEYNATSNVAKCPNRINAPNGLSLDYYQADLADQSGWGSAENGLSIMNTSTQSAPLISNIFDAQISTYSYIYNFSVIARTLPRPSAYDCIFSACARRFSSDVTNGVFHEHVRDRFINETQINTSIEPYNSTGVEVIGPGTHPFNLYFNLTTSAPRNWSNSSMPEVFNIDYVSQNAFPSFFQHEMEGNIVSTAQEPNGSFQPTFPRSDYMQGIWEHGLQDLPQTMENLALAWTNNMRLTGAPAQGVASQGQTYIHVNFLWLIFPAALEFLAFVFLAGTIVSTVRNHVPSWKASALAPLFHGPGPGLEEVLDTYTSMEEYASTTKAGLTDEDGHLRLRIIQHQESHLSEKEDKLKQVGEAVIDVLGAVVG